jgi:hypothetical protein
VEQNFANHLSPIEEFDGLLLKHAIDGEAWTKIDERKLRGILLSRFGQQLLDKICDGYSIHQNINGGLSGLSAITKTALNELFSEISDLPTKKVPLLHAEEWLPISIENGITPFTSDDELTHLASRLERQALNEEVGILEDILNVLLAWRNEKLVREFPFFSNLGGFQAVLVDSHNESSATIQYFLRNCHFGVVEITNNVVKVIR